MTIQEFEEIFNLYYVSLCHYCLKFVRDFAQSEEIVQEQFITLWEKRKNLLAVLNMEAYLKTSVKNRAINFLQSKFNKRHFTDLNKILLKPDNENPVNILEAKELQDILNKAIDSLPDRCYAVYSLKRFGSYKNKEIAQKLSISEKSVENYTTLAFRIIRDHIKKYYSMLILFFYIILS